MPPAPNNGASARPSACRRQRGLAAHCRRVIALRSPVLADDLSLTKSRSEKEMIGVRSSVFPVITADVPALLRRSCTDSVVSATPPWAGCRDKRQILHGTKSVFRDDIGAVTNIGYEECLPRLRPL